MVSNLDYEITGEFKTANLRIKMVATNEANVCSPITNQKLPTGVPNHLSNAAKLMHRPPNF